MTTLLFIYIFSSISAMFGVIFMAAICVNKGLEISPPPMECMEIGNLAHRSSGKTKRSEEAQQPKMTLHAEIETLPIF